MESKMKPNDQPNKFINLKSARLFCHLMASKSLTVSHHWHSCIPLNEHNISQVHSIGIFVFCVSDMSRVLCLDSDDFDCAHTKSFIFIFISFNIKLWSGVWYMVYGVWLMSFAACVYLKFIV